MARLSGDRSAQERGRSGGDAVRDSPDEPGHSWQSEVLRLAAASSRHGYQPSSRLKPQQKVL